MAKIVDLKTLRKIQLLELLNLEELVRICNKHNIQYFLIGGTLIGAVRHKGFIPWDDDIDVGMLRKDFDRFIEVCKTELNTEKFFLQTPQTEKGSADFEIARIRLNNTHLKEYHRRNLNLHDGFFIEILPYDDLPEDDKKAKKYYFKFKYLKRIVGIRMGYRYQLGRVYKRIIFYIVTFFSRLIPLNYLYNKAVNYHKKYENTNSSKVFLLGGAYNYKKESHLRKTVEEYTQLEFEGKNYPVPKNYDMFLREEYGDYLTPPPPERQKSSCLAEYVDFGPYEEYVNSLTDK